MLSSVSNIQSQRNSESNLIHFQTWDAAHAAGYRTRRQWRIKCQRGVKGRSSARINWKSDTICLYHEAQTTTLRPRTLALENLLDRFVVRDDRFAYQPHRTCDWKTESIYCNHPRNLIRQGFNHVRCHEQGIVLDKKLVQGFSIFCDERTDFLAIDLDCHNPTPDAVDVHAELVRLVLDRLPVLLEELGGGSVFCQYRQIEAGGIQIWATFGWDINTRYLHAKARRLLLSLEKSSPGLNQRLQEVGLSILENIEILPTEKHAISMPGCYGKTVFTGEELKLKNGRFDVVALDTHIRNNVTCGDVMPRYRSLLEVALGSPLRPCGTQRAGRTESTNAANEMPVSLSIADSDDLGRRYWTDLKKKALMGVTAPDLLADEYLYPLGQCLFFRDFVHEPDRAMLVEEELFQWVMAKHNGLVSRIIKERNRDIRHQCRHVVRSLEKKTCPAIRRYYQEILLKDLIYPHRVEHLHQYMQAEATSNTTTLFYCKCGVSGSHPEDLVANNQNEPAILDDPLPETVYDKLLEIATAKKEDKNGRLIATMRKKEGEYPFIKFARRFLNRIWQHEGTENIHHRHLNRMLDQESDDRHMTLKYKKLLAHHGLIKGDWEKFIRRGTASSKYRMTSWVKKEFKAARGEVVMRA